ncbi:MAG: tripartite tricarboxylate transporter TctB family protein [Acetobacterales bacterium]
MQKLNNDTIIALILLMVCGMFFWQATLVPDLGYSSMGSAVWPYFILTILTVVSLVYLVQSLRLPPPQAGERPSPKEFVLRYLNPIMCFVIFFLFLVTLPVFGMLIGGGLFVFSTLTALGPLTWRAVRLHLIIALCSVGLMWLIFYYLLGVFLPPGMIIPYY